MKQGAGSSRKTPAPPAGGAAEAVLSELRVLNGRLGRAPRMKDAAAGLVSRAIKYYGSWNKALLAAGLIPKRVVLPRDPKTRERFLLQALRLAALATGEKTLSTASYIRVAREYGGLPANYQVFRLAFGSWENALRRAGLAAVLSAAEAAAAAVKQLEPHIKGRFISSCRLRQVLGGADKKVAVLVRKCLAERGVFVVGRKEKTAELLSLAEALGFPEVGGCEKGRKFAVQLAGGRSYAGIGLLNGYSRERVRQLVEKYLGRVAGLQAAAGTPAGAPAAGQKVLAGLSEAESRQRRILEAFRYCIENFGGLPKISEYRELRRSGKDLPGEHAVVRWFGSWRKASKASREEAFRKVLEAALSMPCEGRDELSGPPCGLLFRGAGTGIIPRGKGGMENASGPGS